MLCLRMLLSMSAWLVLSCVFSPGRCVCVCLFFTLPCLPVVHIASLPSRCVIPSLPSYFFFRLFKSPSPDFCLRPLSHPHTFVYSKHWTQAQNVLDVTDSDVFILGAHFPQRRATQMVIIGRARVSHHLLKTQSYIHSGEGFVTMSSMACAL